MGSIKSAPWTPKIELMISFAVSFIAFVFAWYFLTRGHFQRAWKGESRRFLEREWEVLHQKGRVHFSVPSFKSAYFDLETRPRWRAFFVPLIHRIPKLTPTAIEKQFSILSEDPALILGLSQKDQVLESFQAMQAKGPIQLTSNGRELFGSVVIPVAKEGEIWDSEEFKEFLTQINPLLETQFELPLSEMKPRDLKGWRWALSLPWALALAAALYLVLTTLLPQSQILLEPRGGKIWLGLSLFMTGLGLLWVSLRAPPQYFARMALAYLGLVSWSGYILLHGGFTAINAMTASSPIQLQCSKIEANWQCENPQWRHGVTVSSGPGLEVGTQATLTGVSGWMGQTFARVETVSTPGASAPEIAPPTAKIDSNPSPSAPAEQDEKVSAEPSPDESPDLETETSDAPSAPNHAELKNPDSIEPSPGHSPGKEGAPHLGPGDGPSDTPPGLPRAAAE